MEFSNIYTNRFCELKLRFSSSACTNKKLIGYLHGISLLECFRIIHSHTVPNLFLLLETCITESPHHSLNTHFFPTTTPLTIPIIFISQSGQAGHDFRSVRGYFNPHVSNIRLRVIQEVLHAPKLLE